MQGTQYTSEMKFEKEITQLRSINTSYYYL